MSMIFPALIAKSVQFFASDASCFIMLHEVSSSKRPHSALTLPRAMSFRSAGISCEFGLDDTAICQNRGPEVPENPMVSDLVDDEFRLPF